MAENDSVDPNEQAQRPQEQVPAPVLPPPPVAAISVPQQPQDMPTVKTEMKPTADGGYKVTERTEVTRQVPPQPVVRTYPTLHYGAQNPNTLLRPPMPPASVQTSEPMEHASAAKYFDDCAKANECVEWEVEVRRNGPPKWPEKGKNAVVLRIGELARWPIDNFASLRKRVIDTFGGGKYKLSIRDEDNHVRRTIEISASPLSSPPRNPETEESEEEEPMKTAEGIKPAELSEIEKIKMQKELAKQEAELEMTKAEIESKKEDLARRREAREQANPQIDALREEMRSSKEQTALLLKSIQDQAAAAAQQTRDLITALTSKPDSSKDMLALMQARMDREDQLRREQAEREEKARQEEKAREEKARQEEKAREEKRQEREEQLRRDEKAREDARREREDQLRREQAEKDERYRREREEREEKIRLEEKAQQQQFITTLMQMSDSRNKESIPQMNMLMESIKALNEGNKTFIQAVIETSKASKGDLAETQKANAALVERTFQTIMESQKGDAGKYERLMEALINNKLEAGQRGVEEFVRAMQLGEARSEKMFQMIREAQDGVGEEPAAAPTVDTNQGFWNNLGNIVMALLLSRSGNPEVQQGVAAALGRSNPAALTQADYRQVAQGLTPIVGQQMGMQMPNAIVPVGQQQGMMPPLGGQMSIPMPQQIQMQQPQAQAPFPLPQPPMMAPQGVMQATPPQPVQVAQPPADAASTERLRNTLDEMIDTACDDLTDETREQQWVDYGLDYLPKPFLDALVQCLESKRLDMAVAMLRQNTSVEKFMRLEGLVQVQSKYDLFMKGLVEMIADHQDTSAKPAAAASPNVVPMAPMPVPNLMPEPASGPPASAVAAGGVPITPAGAPIAIPQPPVQS